MAAVSDGTALDRIAELLARPEWEGADMLMEIDAIVRATGRNEIGHHRQMAFALLEAERVGEILAELNRYEAAHLDIDTEGAYDIWDGLIVRLPEYEADATEAVDGGSRMNFAALGTVFSYSHETGGWVTEPYVRGD